jgi:glycosyltransferase involved in cell wall biosynthesis
VRIAQVAPLYESVPPRLYGGTERVVSYLTEELVRLGHEVTLFASGDSETTARLVPGCERALRLGGEAKDTVVPHLILLERVFQANAEFDAVHFHTGYLHLGLARRFRAPCVTTVHGRLDYPELVPLYDEFDEAPHVSISDAQRAPLPWLNWVATIHHGLPADLYRLERRPDDYLAFIGRFSPEKGFDRAVEIARRSGRRLRVAAKVDDYDRLYFDAKVRPLLEAPDIEYVGEIAEHEKQEFLGNAAALLFPIDWPEPFGLVLIEAMACGTPVVAFPRGSVPEIVAESATGFVVEDVAAAVHALEGIERLDRAAVRRAFESRFTVGRMVDDYLAVYRRLATRGLRRAG